MIHSRVHFDRHAKLVLLVLLVALGLIALSFTQMVYRFTRPTDGWAVYTEELDRPDWFYERNLVGVSSPIQPNYRLVAIEDQNLRGKASIASSQTPANWRVGQQVEVTVLRAGKILTINVPLLNWTITTLWG